MDVSLPKPLAGVIVIAIQGGLPLPPPERIGYFFIGILSIFFRIRKKGG
jgi:hypothetical protein